MSTPDPGTLEDMRRIGALLQSGQFRAAHDRLEAIVASHPRFVEGLRLLAGAKQALGDPTSAERLLRQALGLDPGWIPTLATLGEMLLAAGRGAEAEPLLRRAASGTPPFARAVLLLARWYNDTGRPALALAVTAPLCADGGADAELAGQHVAALHALGRAEEAVSHYRRILESVPGNVDATLALAFALGAAGRHAEAAHAAEIVIGRGRRSAALYNAYARSLIAEGRRDAAEAALRECVRLEPRLVEAQSNLAQLVWMRSGDVGESLAGLDRALEAFANDDALWAAKAAILQGAGDARGALACLESRLPRAQASPMLVVRAGLAALEVDSAAALRLAERAVQALPGHAPARALLVAALLGVGEAARALPHCEALRAASPDDQYLIALETTAWRLLGDSRYVEVCNYEALVQPYSIEPPAPWTDLAGLLADLRASLDRLHDPDGHPLLFQSLRHGTETTQDLSRSEDPVIQGLFRSFAAPIEAYLALIGRGDDPLRRRNQGRWRFNGSWSVRLRASGHHRNHVHPRGWISSACYVALPDHLSEARSEEGILTFGEPSIRTTPALAAEYTVRPRAGMLVLFPSYLWHGTVPFAGDQPRITVAFDAVPA